MLQRIIILLTKKYIQAAYLEDEKCSPLSIEGNKKISYSDEKDLNRVKNAITGIFNLESLDSADISVMVVACGAASKTVKKLNDFFSITSECNSVFVEHILPYILLGKGLLKKKTEQTVRISDVCYKLDYHGQNLECVQIAKSNTAGIVLEAHDFAPLFSFNASNLGKDEKLLNQLNDLIIQNKKAVVQISQNKKQIEDLKKQIAFLNNCAWNIVYWRYDNNIKEMLNDKTKKNSQEHISHALSIDKSDAVALLAESIKAILVTQTNKSFSDAQTNKSSSAEKNLKFSFSKLHENGAVVEKDDSLAIIKIISKKITDKFIIDYVLKSNIAGRVFYLIDEGDIGIFTPVAIVCDKDVNLSYVDNIKRNIELFNSPYDVEINLQDKKDE
jgi:hypothetical protein